MLTRKFRGNHSNFFWYTAAFLAFSTNALADVQEQLADYLTRAGAYGFSGAVLVAKDGQILVEMGVGFADRSQGLPVTAQTAFLVGSITKQFTAAAILHLEMSGKLNTTDPISKHLEFIPEDKRGITIHHALTHTGGFGNLYWDQNPSLSEREFLEMIIQKRFPRPPGERFRYSNSGYHFLKAVIEAVSGDSYEAYLRDHLFIPSEMHNTGFALPKWNERQVAHYEDWTTKVWKVPVANPLSRPIYLQPEGSGGILSTVGDLYRWNQVLQGDGVLSKNALKKLFTPFLNKYAYGWYVGTTDRGTRMINHGGLDTSIGVVAGFYSYPDENAAIILLANTTMNGRLIHATFVQQLERILFGKTVTFPPPPAKIADPPLDTFAGSFALSEGGVIDLTVDNGRLIASVDDPDAIRTLIFPNAGDVETRQNENPEIVDLFHNINDGKFGPVEKELTPRIDAEKFATRWRRRWKGLVKSHGPFQEARLVHNFKFVYEGQPEEQYFVMLRFERSTLIYRAIRNETGWFDVTPYTIPKHLELTLARTGPYEFNAWDFRLETGPRIVFTDDSASQELSIQGSHAKSVARKK